MGDEELRALDRANLHIRQGEFVSIIGPSGSGKSTLMNIIGCLDTADEGEYLLDGMPIENYSESALARIRSRKIGFIFQSFNLIGNLDAAEYKNVVLGLILVYTVRQDKMTSWRLTNPVTIFGSGFALGALAIFLGIGGGPLNLAALSLLFSLGAKEGAVYSLAIIFFSQLSKLVLSAANGALWAVDLSFVPFVVIPAIAGGFIGTHFNRKLSEEGVRKVYIATMVLLPLISLYSCVTNLLEL